MMTNSIAGSPAIADNSLWCVGLLLWSVCFPWLCFLVRLFLLREIPALKRQGKILLYFIIIIKRKGNIVSYFQAHIEDVACQGHNAWVFGPTLGVGAPATLAGELTVRPVSQWQSQTLLC